MHVVHAVYRNNILVATFLYQADAERFILTLPNWRTAVRMQPIRLREIQAIWEEASLDHI